MVEVIIAPHAGFCFGVKRAINLTEKASNKANKRVYTLGPLIHNPQEVKRLESLGIYTTNSEDSLEEGDTIIIRSHGIPPTRERQLHQMGLNVVDATCPYVKAVHEAVTKLVKEGYFVVIVGEKDHPEIIGTFGYMQEAGGDGVVVETKDDLKKVLGKEKVGVVAQTTQNEQFFKEVVGEIALWVKELKVINTICNATSERQEDVYELAPKVDVMIIVGGKNSGNTRRLYEISKSLNPRSYHIETEEELQKDWFDNAQRIGITAGASTPDWIIERVHSKIKELCLQEV